MRTIQEYSPEIKRWAVAAVGEWGMVAIVVLVGVLCFGLGRLSAYEMPQPPVAVGKVTAAAKPNALYMGALLVASRTGSVYYYPWCSGALNIAPQNQRWFDSGSEARSAGYRPSKSCSGLE